MARIKIGQSSDKSHTFYVPNICLILSESHFDTYIRL